MGLLSTTYVNRSRTVHSGPNYPQTVHEHKAPTDESVRLLREMESNALENILNTVTLDNNVVKAKFVFYQKVNIDFNVNVRIMFELNNTVYKIDKVIDSIEWRKHEEDYSYHTHRHIHVLYDTMGQLIAGALLEKTLQDNPEMLK